MLTSSGKYKYLKKDDKISKKGMPYSTVVFADTETYERFSYFADKDIKISVGEGAMCKFVLKPRSQGDFNTDHTCVSISAV